MIIMPNHKTHDAIGIVATVPIAITTVYVGYSVIDAVVLSVGIIVATYMLSPDLDLNSRIYHRWGLLRWIWIPYQKIIHHRSWLSHSGPISATIRLAYLLAWLSPFLQYVYYLPLITIWCAVCISDTLHLAADMYLKDLL